MTLSSVKKKQSLAAGGEPIADHPVLVPEKAAVSRLVRGVEQDSEAEAIRALWRRIEAPVTAQLEIGGHSESSGRYCRPLESQRAVCQG
jgi:hypothetical protein